MTAPGDITPEEQRHVDELEDSVATWVSVLQLAGYDNSSIAGALVMKFREMAVEDIGPLGYVNLLAGMIRDEMDDMQAAAIASEGGE
jgi:hypothetical protein